MAEFKMDEPGFDADIAVHGDRRNLENRQRRPNQEEEDEEEDAPTYTPAQLTSLLPPVSTTMLLASIVIVNVRSDSVDSLLSTSLGTYAVSSYIPASSNSSDTDDDSFLFALLNAAVIIAGIAFLTFGIVLCYKFKCYKFLYGFFTFTIFVALAFETGQILFAFFEKFQVAADWVSLVFILYNFAIVGAVGILYGKIVPRTLSQGYLICISICICYLLRYFPEWTGWILLVLLALWDLFAVLAPCGPLKALVKMASERQDPIPGLLYTAGASADTEIRVARTNDDGDDSSDEDTADQSQHAGAAPSDVRVTVAPRPSATTEAFFEDAENVPEGADHANNDAFGFDSDDEVENEDPSADAAAEAESDLSTSETESSGEEEVPLGSSNSGGGGNSASASAARDNEQHSNEQDDESFARSSQQLEDDAALARRLHEEELSEQAAAALAAEDAHGSVDDEDAARAAAVAAAAAEEEEEEEEEEDRSVKLGLGDFIFYSLLVGKAALAGWVSFAICFVVIICGLLSTMILLALLKKPLPALPFSMLFGVSFFFWAQYTLAPQGAFMVLTGTYV